MVESNLCQTWRREGEVWTVKQIRVHMGLSCERAYAQDGFLIPISYGLEFEMGLR